MLRDRVLHGEDTGVVGVGGERVLWEQSPVGVSGGVTACP